MIDKTHLRRIMNYCEDFDLRKTDAYLPLAQAIWREAQAEERERCARICEARSNRIVETNRMVSAVVATLECAAEIREGANHVY